jgi:hypothetical protein
VDAKRQVAVDSHRPENGSLRHALSHTRLLAGEVAPMKIYTTLDELKAAADFIAIKDGGKVTECHTYLRPDELFYDQVVFRLEFPGGKKRFMQAHQEDDGSFVFGGLHGRPNPIYNRSGACGLAERQGEPVVVVEGEKCANALNALDILTTTSPGGAKNAAKADWSLLGGRDVTIWPDSDDPGSKYAQDVIAALTTLKEQPASIRLLDPAPLALGDGGDVADFIKALRDEGKDDDSIRASVLAAVEKAAPVEFSRPTSSISTGEPVEPGSSADGRRLPSALLNFNVKEDPLCLLGNRWLGRGGGAFLFAETGQGKSVLVMQAAILWALGRSFFGITPRHPLKVGLWQAENDDGDCAEMFQGIVNELELGAFADELDERLRVQKETQRRGKDLIDLIRPAMFDWRPDVLILDPLFSYLDGEINKAEDCAAFLRGLLNPFAAEFGNAWLIVHHVPKPTRKKDASEGFNLSYAGHGSAELSNWCRASLALRATGTSFELAASKRGKRSGLIDAEGNPATAIALRHSEKGICWLRDAVTFDLEKEEIEETAKEVISRMPVTSTFDRGEVRELVQKTKGCSRKTVYQKGSKAFKIWTRVMELTRSPNNPSVFSRCHLSPDCHLPVTSDTPSQWPAPQELSHVL